MNARRPVLANRLHRSQIKSVEGRMRRQKIREEHQAPAYEACHRWITKAWRSCIRKAVHLLKYTLDGAYRSHRTKPFRRILAADQMPNLLDSAAANVISPPACTFTSSERRACACASSCRPPESTGRVGRTRSSPRCIDCRILPTVLLQPKTCSIHLRLH